MNGFERRKEQKKESIRKAALELFKTYGIRKVSLKDIADKAIVSPVTIYNHFGSKQGLVRDVAKWLFLNIESYYTEILRSDQPYTKRWERLLFEKNEIRNMYHPELIKTIISEDPEIRQLVDMEMRTRVSQLMIDFIEEGKLKGHINPDISSNAILFYSEMVRNFAYARPDLYGMLIENDVLYQEFLSLFLYGLVDKKSSIDIPDKKTSPR